MDLVLRISLVKIPGQTHYLELPERDLSKCIVPKTPENIMDIQFSPIGVIRTPFAEIKGTPVQPSASQGTQGRIELNEDLVPGLADLDGFSHLILIYHLHRSSGYNLQVVPFMDDQPRGLFATRAPKRPNPIGLSVVKLLRIEGSVLHIENIDALDGTPLLDIKPYVPQLDHAPEVRIGWLAEKLELASVATADERFK
jgi:tRNA-Thr(GGU) m(6)t(6)A37 methyltransferase TsaA